MPVLVRSDAPYQQKVHLRSANDYQQYSLQDPEVEDKFFSRKHEINYTEGR